jgi:hypothetical protein
VQQITASSLLFSDPNLKQKRARTESKHTLPEMRIIGMRGWRIVVGGYDQQKIQHAVTGNQMAPPLQRERYILTSNNM